MDGNVARVLTRLTGERGDIKSNAVRSRLRAIADALLDRKRPGEFNQALMELGATVCLPKRPLCKGCPLPLHCEARKQGFESQLPVIGVRPETDRRQKNLLIIEKAGKILFWQRPAESSRLAKFWELPEREQLPGAAVTGQVGTFRHTIVHTTYLVEVCRATLKANPRGFRWLAKKGLSELPVSTTAMKALSLSSSK